MSSQSGSNPLVKAIARWDNEGGAVPLSSLDDDDLLLKHLGEAVIRVWSDLPRDIQRILFDVAIKTETTANPDDVRHHLALFLHHHKTHGAK